jgi:hypothetical protein
LSSSSSMTNDGMGYDADCFIHSASRRETIAGVNGWKGQPGKRILLLATHSNARYWLLLNRISFISFCSSPDSSMIVKQSKHTKKVISSLTKSTWKMISGSDTGYDGEDDAGRLIVKWETSRRWLDTSACPDVDALDAVSILLLRTQQEQSVS